MLLKPLLILKSRLIWIVLKTQKGGEKLEMGIGLTVFLILIITKFQKEKQKQKHLLNNLKKKDMTELLTDKK